MENNKNSKGLIVLVIILIICILGLGGYIVYDKILNKPTPTTDNTKSSTTKPINNESETYIIDKNTKKVLTLEEIISSYKNYTDMIDILKKYINDNYDKLYSNDLYEKNKIIYEVEDSLKNNNYSLYYNNNDELIIIITPLIGEGMTSTFIYSNNEWKEYNDEIAGTLW